jgi:ribosomal-protein-alanine N-acetyltransferase
MIVLKPAGLDDAEVIFNAWGRYPRNFTYLLAQVFSDVADAQRYLENVFSTPESKAFHIVDPENGVVGIVKAIIVGHTAKIGYVVHKPFWGRGVATTAVREVVGVVEASPAISRIWATCALDNVASARVLEKCGFQREAILKNWAMYPAQDGRALDNYSYVKIPERPGQ